ncbi:hypothetical protein EON63_19805 [archaeon]|nr:MAG: hypothetical protein EON63_19805 [archaeon]
MCMAWQEAQGGGERQTHPAIVCGYVYVYGTLACLCIYLVSNSMKQFLKYTSVCVYTYCVYVCMCMSVCVSTIPIPIHIQEKNHRMRMKMKGGGINYLLQVHVNEKQV